MRRPRFLLPGSAVLGLTLALMLLNGCGQSRVQPPATVPSGQASAASWEQIVSAAKREGKLSIAGQGVPETRQALVQGFQSRYPGIEVEYDGTGGADIPPKVVAEQKS